MKLCIVGQGPTAEGHGEEIDACDYVVRIKAYWQCGAKNAGEKIDALAHYGSGWTNRPEPAKRAEQWFTQTVKQLQQKGSKGQRRHQLIVERSQLGVIRWVTQELWERVACYLNGKHPTTGMMAVAMALELFPTCNLVLYGYDSTTPDKPNFWDARQHADMRAPHDVLSEKRAIAQIFHGEWLGEPTKATLEWPQMPDLT